MRVALMSGGVGGARLARGLAALPEVDLTVVVNVGDDEEIYGLYVSPDLDTVMYTLGGLEGPQGWGMADDRFTVMEALYGFPIDSTFMIGDRDLATNLFRTDRLQAGWTLSWVTTALGAAFRSPAVVLPVTDDRLRTKVHIPDEGWVTFQEYFVRRGHQVEIDDIRFDGAADAKAAPGVVEAIETADLVVIGPSNPPLSIWPVLAVSEVADALEQCRRVVGVSPLIGGTAIKGPAHRVLKSLGFASGNGGVVAAYDGLLTDLFVYHLDADDVDGLDGVRVHAADTRIEDREAAVRFAQELLARV
jgi:LPPG:FO 2-phospho-L-lactate transferase